MRVTNTMLHSSINTNLQKQMSKLYDLNDDLSSGVKLHKTSDDPFNVGLSLKYDTNIKENKQWISNMENGKQWLGFSTEALSHSKDIVQQMYTKAIQADNDTLNDSNRDALAAQVDAQLEELVKMGNTTYQGKYIFNGDVTNVPPFQEIREDGKIVDVAQFIRFEDGNPDNPIYVSYNNNSTVSDGTYYDKQGQVVNTVINDASAGHKSIDGRINRRTNENNYVDIAVNGGSVFQPNGANGNGDVFRTAIDLRDGLLNNSTAEIGAQIDELQRSMDRITSENSRAGTVYNRLDSAQELMISNDVSLTDALSKIEDTDVASAMMDYTRLEATYQMSLQIGAQIMQTSLVSFI